MGNEVEKLILLKAHLSLPYQDLRDNETKRNQEKQKCCRSEIFTVMSLFDDELIARQVNKKSKKKLHYSHVRIQFSFASN